MAVRSGHLENIKALLEAGADLDAQDKGGRTPLHMAARSGFTAHADKVEIINTLLEPLKALPKEKRSETLLAVLTAQDQQGQTPLHVALESASDSASDADKVEIINTLLAPLKALPEEKRSETLLAVLMAQDKQGRTPLHRAAQQYPAHIQNLARIKALLKVVEEYPDVRHKMLIAKDKYGKNPLHTALGWGCGHLENVNALIEAVAGYPKTLQAMLIAKDENDRTPLHTAASQNPASIKVLLKAVEEYPDVQRNMLIAQDKNGMTALDNELITFLRTKYALPELGRPNHE
jgi:ankyrin repeat protein